MPAKYNNEGLPSWQRPTKLESLGILSKALVTKLGCLSDPAGDSDASITAQLDPVYSFPRKTPASEFSLPCTSVRSVWVGHASLVTDFPTSDPDRPFRVAFDPLFEKYCSPVRWPRRKVGVPFSIEDMGRVDAVVISHNHYDHLSKESIQAIERLNTSTQYFVPLGTGSWFTDNLHIPSDRVLELDWKEGVRLGGVDSGFKDLGRTHTSQTGSYATLDEKTDLDVKEKDGDVVAGTTVPTLTKDGQMGAGRLGVEVVDDDDAITDIPASRPTEPSEIKTPPGTDSTAFTITCEQAQHADGRDFLFRDKGHSKCATWVINQHPIRSTEGELEIEGTKMFFGGDTGYRSKSDGEVATFVQDIRDRHGAINLIAVAPDSGSLSKSWGIPAAITRRMHATPDDAVDMSNVLSKGLELDREEGDDTAQRMRDMGYSDKTATIFIHHTTFDTKSGAEKTMRELRSARWNKGRLGNLWKKRGLVVVQPGVWQNMADL